MIELTYKTYVFHFRIEELSEALTISKKDNDKLREELEASRNLNLKLCVDNSLPTELLNCEEWKNENVKLKNHIQHLHGDSIDSLNFNYLRNLLNSLRQSQEKIEK